MVDILGKKEMERKDKKEKEKIECVWSERMKDLTNTEGLTEKVNE